MKTNPMYALTDKQRQVWHTYRLDPNMPTYKLEWVVEYYDELWDMYQDIREFCQQRALPIGDKGNFTGFCLLLSNMSSLDQPLPNLGAWDRRFSEKEQGVEPFLEEEETDPDEIELI